MINNNSQEAFIETFKNNLKKDARTVSVATLLSDGYFVCSIAKQILKLIHTISEIMYGKKINSLFL